MPVRVGFRSVRLPVAACRPVGLGRTLRSETHVPRRNAYGVGVVHSEWRVFSLGVTSLSRVRPRRLPEAVGQTAAVTDGTGAQHLPS